MFVEYFKCTLQKHLSKSKMLNISIINVQYTYATNLFSFIIMIELTLLYFELVEFL